MSAASTKDIVQEKEIGKELDFFVTFFACWIEEERDAQMGKGGLEFVFLFCIETSRRCCLATLTSRGGCLANSLPLHSSGHNWPQIMRRQCAI